MAGENKKLVNELKDLREKYNKAEKRKEYDLMAQACLDIIALDKRARNLNILAFLYYKDLGEAYMRLHEYTKAVESLETAKAGLLEYRATQRLKFPEDWLNELKIIEKLIDKIETVHLKTRYKA